MGWYSQWQPALISNYNVEINQVVPSRYIKHDHFQLVCKTHIKEWQWCQSDSVINLYQLYSMKPCFVTGDFKGKIGMLVTIYVKFATEGSFSFIHTHIYIYIYIYIYAQELTLSKMFGR